MAHFRGTIKGSRGQASRLGTASSGMQVEAQSWQGKVVTELYQNVNGTDYVRISLKKHKGEGTDRVIYVGPVGCYEPK